MNESTLDLFCNSNNHVYYSTNEDESMNDIFDAALEEQASKYEVTVDYYIEEFLV